MAKTHLFKLDEFGRVVEEIEFKGEIELSTMTKSGDEERNQPVISLDDKEGFYMRMEMSWAETITLWEELTGLVGHEIITARVKDVLIKRKTYHRCGAPYQEVAKKEAEKKKGGKEEDGS